MKKDNTAIFVILAIVAFAFLFPFEKSILNDSKGPEIEIYSPSDMVYSYKNNIPLEISVIDKYLYKCWYTIEQTDDNGYNWYPITNKIPIVGCKNTTISVDAAGEYSVTVHAKDIFGNEDSYSKVLDVLL